MSRFSEPNIFKAERIHILRQTMKAQRTENAAVTERSTAASHLGCAECQSLLSPPVVARGGPSFESSV